MDALARALTSWRALPPMVRRVVALSATGAAVAYLVRRRNAQLKARAVPVLSTNSKVGVNREFFDQISKLLPVLFPSFFCREVALLGAHTTCLLARTVASIWLANMDGRIVKALITGQGRKFLLLLGIWLASAVPIAFVNAAIKFLKHSLALAFRTRLTKLAHDQYLRGLTYYQLEQLDGRLPNPDQCLTTDIAKFCTSLADLYSNLAKPALDVAIYNAQLAYNVGTFGLFSVTLLFSTGTAALRFFTPPFGVLTADQQNLEGQFRFYHSRVATNAEEIAFYGGAQIEKGYLNDAFDELKRHSLKLYRAQLQFGTLESFVVKYFWGALGFIVCALPVFTPFGRPANARAVSSDMADRTAGFFTNRRILMNTSDAFGRIMSSWRKVNELSGYTSRVAQMFEVFDDMEANRFQRDFRPLPPSGVVAPGPRAPFRSEGRVEYSASEDGDIAVSNLALVNPTGDVLARDLTFSVPRGAHLMISGPNGCGKSSLFRVLGGLWPVVSGTVRKPRARNALFYIPQRPYLSLGSLRDQIIYPMTHDAMRAQGTTDADLIKILDIVQLAYLVDNYGGFDSVKNWKDCLSGGEKQRVAMARLFFARPAYAILDECSSAVSIDVEGAMYAAAKELGISLITVSHRHTLWRYHDYLLTMDGKGGWSFGPMAEHSKQGLQAVQHLTLLEEKRDLEKRLGEIASLLRE